MAKSNLTRSKQEPNLEPRFFGTRSAANYLGLSPRTLEKYRWTGDGPTYVKCGSRCLYKVVDLDRWMEEGIRRSTSDAA